MRKEYALATTKTGFIGNGFITIIALEVSCKCGLVGLLAG
jgi:hypothetical protein